MLFRKKIKKSCAYCIHSAALEDEQLLCDKKGVVSSDKKCIKFKYDPCKRVPLKPKTLDFEKYNEEDYSL